MAFARRKVASDWEMAYVDPTLQGTQLLAEARSDGAQQLLFVTEAKYDFVHPVKTNAAPFQTSLRCECGSPNPDGACTSGSMTKPYTPESMAQRRFLTDGMTHAGGDVRPDRRGGAAWQEPSAVVDYLKLRASPRPRADVAAA